MGIFELSIVLTIAVVLLVWLAQRIHVPYPMLLMIGGLLLVIIPAAPTVSLDPDVALVIFFPPILFQAARTTSIRDFKANVGAISRLAVGLVLVTTVLVAIVAHAVIPGISWPAAFVLGAIVSPPDAVAAAAIFHRVGAPRRIVTILEGESLVNDASAIIVYTFAVAAVVSGNFSLPDALLSFFTVAAIGIGIGLAVGWVLTRIVVLLDEPSLEAITTLIAPVSAYVLADRLEGSGVLAVVAAGLFYGRIASRIQSPSSRMRTETLWVLVNLFVNGMVFILIGSELGVLRKELASRDLPDLLWHAVAVLAAMVVARFAYIYASILLERGRSLTSSDTFDLKSRFIVAWSGLRGVVSLATALALPYMTDRGTPFDHRNEIVLITALVMTATLFGFGLPLPWIVRKLRFPQDKTYEREMLLAQQTVWETMQHRLSESVRDDPTLEQTLGPMRSRLQAQVERIESARENEHAGEIDDAIADRTEARQAAIRAARDALLELRDQGEIGDEVRREMERRLDLEQLAR